LRWLKQLDETLDKNGEIESFASRLEAVNALLCARRPRLLLVGEAEKRDEIEAAVERVWAGHKLADRAMEFTYEGTEGAVRQGWATNTQVSFCAKAYGSVPQDHPDAAALTVLGPYLRNGFLHRAIREQGGAYGAGAGYDADTGAFRFFSYRDPRLEDTLTDFDASTEWLAADRHAARGVEEAILGVVGSIDRPNSPAGEAVSAYFAGQHGRSPEQRLRFRARVLEVTLDDLKRVGSQYLVPDRASVAVVSDMKSLENVQHLGLDLIRL
jgi:Zn-dependent M16 (insulinase) family peptidase